VANNIVFLHNTHLFLGWPAQLNQEIMANNGARAIFLVVHYAGRIMVGRTHEDVDALFGNISQWLKRNDAFTLAGKYLWPMHDWIQRLKR
jgi:hypothetical protein